MPHLSEDERNQIIGHIQAESSISHDARFFNVGEEMFYFGLKVCGHHRYDLVLFSIQHARSTRFCRSDGVRLIQTRLLQIKLVRRQSEHE